MKHKQFFQNKLLCLTRDDPNLCHSRQVEIFIEAGFRFIQLRSKSLPAPELFRQAKLAVEISKSNNCTLIINDFVDLACQVNADGVHLGKTDRPISYVRKMLKSNKVIGMTLHSLEEARSVVNNCPDYVGVGPYRRSKTKEHLNPILTDQDYRDIVYQIYPIPAYLIGGLKSNDFSLTKSLGVHGIAICSELFSGESLSQQAKYIYQSSRSLKFVAA